MYDSNSSLNSTPAGFQGNFNNQQFNNMQYNQGNMATNNWQQNFSQGNNMTPAAQNAGFSGQTTESPASGANANAAQFANNSQSWQQQQPGAWDQGSVNQQTNWQSSGAAGQPVSKPAGGDSYQRTFDYVQQCQNWTSQ